jgi:cytochrome b involved in lipid metabolism
MTILNYSEKGYKFNNIKLPHSNTHPLAYENFHNKATNNPNNAAINSIHDKPIYAPAVPRSTSRIITIEQLNQHNKRGDNWIAVSGCVYDVSRWSLIHPGGELTILGVAGKDCTDVFTVFHSREIIEKQLPRFQIGNHFIHNIVSSRIS